MRLARYLATAVMAGSLTASAVLLTAVHDDTVRNPFAGAQQSVTVFPAEVNVESLVVRAGPGLNSTQVTSVYFGDSVLVTDGPVAADGYDWYLLEADGVTLGWSVEGFAFTGETITLAVEPVAPAPPIVPEAQTTWEVTSPFLIIRSEPSADATVARIATSGEELLQDPDVEPVEVDGDQWFPVEDGWVGGPAGGESAGVTLLLYPLYVTASALNVRADPSLSAEVLDVLPYGAAVNVYGSFRDEEGNDWNAVDKDGSLWVSAEWVTISLEGLEEPSDSTTSGSVVPVG
ncbi:MAG TPA: SH3 domain-containing protein [Thermomicrobiales bacterium]|jgi:hypothetical protein|nr:SH3 domain-containing protein [Thermomicrobiales bacterium]